MTVSNSRHRIWKKEILLDELARKTDVYQLSWSDRSIITIASALHDIGKIGINEGILNKQEKLTLEEEQIVQAHTLIGAALLKKNPELYQNEELVCTAYQISR